MAIALILANARVTVDGEDIDVILVSVVDDSDNDTDYQNWTKPYI